MRASPAECKSVLQLRMACGAFYAVGGVGVVPGRRVSGRRASLSYYAICVYLCASVVR